MPSGAGAASEEAASAELAGALPASEAVRMEKAV